MSDLQPGDPFLYMKVGVHANESLQDIIQRKRAEIAEAGVSFWGYGGNCHPYNAVQPFIREVSGEGVTVRLLMQEITSRHFAVGEAKEYSPDGKEYLPVPKGVKVLGSRYALVLTSLDEIDQAVSLSDTLVGVGPKRGTTGDKYIRGHVDKACLIYQPTGAPVQDKAPIVLRLAGQLAAPYAVVLR